MVGLRPRSAAAGALAVAILLGLLAVSTSLVRTAVATPRGHASAFAPAQITDFSGWFPLPISGASPTARTAGQMTYDSGLGTVLLFGGCAGAGGASHCTSYLNDTWTYTAGHWTLVQTTGGPAARAGGMVADDPSVGGVVLFGGRTASGPVNDTWVYEAAGWTELHPPHAPPPRYDGALAFDSIDSDLVLVGGFVGNITTGNQSTWTYDGGDWKQVMGSVGMPPGWISPYLAPDPATGQLVLFGGLTSLNATPDFGQTWLFADGSWRNESIPLSFSPLPRLGGLYGFDAFTDEPVLFGGGTPSTADGDLWELEGSSNWSEEWGGNDPAENFLDTQSAWDPPDGYTVEFGNESASATYADLGAVSNQTWGLLSVLTVQGSSLGGTLPASVDAPVDLSATIVGGLPPYALHWDPGDGNELAGNNLTHAYTRAGSFQVTLNVTDAVGEQLSEVLGIVDVTTPPVPPTPPSLTWASVGFILAEAGAVATVVALVLWSRRRRERA